MLFGDLMEHPDLNRKGQRDCVAGEQDRILLLRE